MSKTHILRKDKTTPSGPNEHAWTLCGRVLLVSELLEMDEGATCLRCLKYYQKKRSAVNISQSAKDSIELAARRLLFGSAGSKEVRTTSSTGGQKGVKEAQYNLIPVAPLEELAVLFGRGARKYDVHQWRKGYELSKGYDAMVRHQNAFWAGLDFDVCSNDPSGCQHVDSKGEPFIPPGPDTCYNHTGAHHLIAVAWHAFVMRELVETHPEHDNRYILTKE